jgi:TonB-dependent starch-binding outer membrane protein SusC
MKNMSLSWTLPRQWQKGLHLQNFRIYAQAQNLITITHYKGLDPENQNISSLPPLRTVTIGLQLGF